MPSLITRSAAAIRQRCPRCLEGRVFKSSLQMNELCPSCGLEFKREPGYYLGAMYFSYGIACVLISAFTIALVLSLPGYDDKKLVLVAAAMFGPFVPITFRLSRSLWLHFDQIFDPA